MLKKTIPILLLLSFAFTLSPAQQKKQPITGFEQYRKPGADLVPLKIVTGKLQTYTNKDLKTKNHFFLIMFNPTCTHCIRMTKLLSNNAGQFSDSKVVFMAPATMMAYLGDFEKQTGVYKHPQFIVGVDSAYAVDKLFVYGTLLPQINIYNADGKLVKTFHGDTPLDSLMHYIP